MNQVELQVLQGVLSLVTLAIGVALSVLTPKLKTLVDRHVDAKKAQIANTVIDGLAKVAEGVVNEFNQKVVGDAKAHGLFTPQLQQSVKADAVAAVMSQAGALVALGKQVVGEVEPLIGSLIEKAVVEAKSNTQSSASASAQSDVTDEAAEPVQAAQPQEQVSPQPQAQ